MKINTIAYISPLYKHNTDYGLGRSFKYGGLSNHRQQSKKKKKKPHSVSKGSVRFYPVRTTCSIPQIKFDKAFTGSVTKRWLRNVGFGGSVAQREATSQQWEFLEATVLNFHEHKSCVYKWLRKEDSRNSLPWKNKCSSRNRFRMGSGGVWDVRQRLVKPDATKIGITEISDFRTEA